MSFTMFDDLSTSESEYGLRVAAAQDDLGRAIIAIRAQFGEWLGGAEDKADFEARLSFVKNDMHKIASGYIFPRPGVMRRVYAALRPRLAGEEEGIPEAVDPGVYDGNDVQTGPLSDEEMGELGNNGRHKTPQKSFVPKLPKMPMAARDDETTPLVPEPHNVYDPQVQDEPDECFDGPVNTDAGLNEHTEELEQGSAAEPERWDERMAAYAKLAADELIPTTDNDYSTGVDLGGLFDGPVSPETGTKEYTQKIQQAGVKVAYDALPTDEGDPDAAAPMAPADSAAPMAPVAPAAPAAPVQQPMMPQARKVARGTLRTPRVALVRTACEISGCEEDETGKVTDYEGRDRGYCDRHCQQMSNLAGWSRKEASSLYEKFVRWCQSQGMTPDSPQATTAFAQATGIDPSALAGQAGPGAGAPMPDQMPAGDELSGLSDEDLGMK